MIEAPLFIAQGPVTTDVGSQIAKIGVAVRRKPRPLSLVRVESTTVVETPYGETRARPGGFIVYDADEQRVLALTAEQLAADFELVDDSHGGVPSATDGLSPTEIIDRAHLQKQVDELTEKWSAATAHADSAIAALRESDAREAQLREQIAAAETQSAAARDAIATQAIRDLAETLKRDGQDGLRLIDGGLVPFRDEETSPSADAIAAPPADIVAAAS